MGSCSGWIHELLEFQIREPEALARRADIASSPLLALRARGIQLPKKKSLDPLKAQAFFVLPTKPHSNSLIGSRSSRIYIGRPALFGKVIDASMPIARYNVESTWLADTRRSRGV